MEITAFHKTFPSYLHRQCPPCKDRSRLFGCARPCQAKDSPTKKGFKKNNSADLPSNLGTQCCFHGDTREQVRFLQNRISSDLPEIKREEKLRVKYIEMLTENPERFIWTFLLRWKYKSPPLAKDTEDTQYSEEANLNLLTKHKRSIV